MSDFSKERLYFIIAKEGPRFGLIISILSWFFIFGLLSLISIPVNVLLLGVKINLGLFSIVVFIQGCFFLQHPTQVIEHDIIIPLNAKQRQLGFDKILHPDTKRQSQITGVVALLSSLLFIYLAFTITI